MKDRIIYNGTIGSDHNIDISSKLPLNATFFPIQWGYEQANELYQLFGNSFTGDLCSCSTNIADKIITLIPRDSKRIETFNYLFVYYWVQLAQ